MKRNNVFLLSILLISLSICTNCTLTTPKNEKKSCKGKDDGTYCTRSSFEYMVCKAEKASVVSCGGTKLYDPQSKLCVPSVKVSSTNYCSHRPNGDYNWPWNCHKYVTCSNGNYYLFNCSRPELVYDPKTDACKHPDEVKCKEIVDTTPGPKTTKRTPKPSDPCYSKPDGKYCTKDSFEYMLCKDQVASYVPCEQNNIFDPASESCVLATREMMPSYCKHRPNGDYNWPWNCHMYVACSNHFFYLFTCSRQELIYDPKSNSCKNPDEMKCKYVKRSPRKIL